MNLLFFVPFLGFGLLVAGIAGYQLLALFNPRPRLTLSRAVLLPGETAELRWQFQGNCRQIERLQIRLEGAEVHVHGRGKARHVEHKKFATLDLADVTRHVEIAAGRVEFRVPNDARPSQESSPPRVEWHVRVRARIPHHPDITLDYPVRVGNPTAPP
ncbi:MAG: hypothetical protein N3A53_06480 [Verrucomicrobiae bacterium]|nr:hypothetical protein [Verrucomicrobiae bacterium]